MGDSNGICDRHRAAAGCVGCAAEVGAKEVLRAVGLREDLADGLGATEAWAVVAQQVRLRFDDISVASGDRGSRADRLEMRLDAIRRASQAMAGLDRETLAAVTPAAMRAVLAARGWSHSADIPWYKNRSVTAFEEWDHPTAKRRGRRDSAPRDVLVPVAPGMADTHRRVAEWAEAVASRHGDVSAAEVLAEALAEALWGGR